MHGDHGNQLIQEMCRDPERMAAFREDPEHYFDVYGLDEAEKTAFRTCDPMALVSDAGVHPILSMHYLFTVDPDTLKQMSIRSYPQLREED